MQGSENHRDASFIIVEENSCPVYESGEELKVQGFNLITPSCKSSCLHLARKVADVVTIKDRTGTVQSSGPRSKFDCGGGCQEGRIFFEYKTERDFATRQMKMLKEVKKRQDRKHIRQHFSKLRTLSIFNPLSDSSLAELTNLLEFKTYPKDKRVVKKGAPGNNLYIILKGSVGVVSHSRTKVADLKAGEIFGEMSLLSGEPVSSSVHTLEESELASLSVMNFRSIMRGYHALQFFLLKLLVDRSQTTALRSGYITSGMTGNLESVNPSNLFFILESSSKTGALRLSLPQGKGIVYFRQGRIVYARYQQDGQQFRQQEAVFRLLAETRGHFSYTRGIPKELENSPPIEGI